MKTVRLSILSTAALMMTAMLLWVGCEESTTDMTINVSPASVGVTNNYVITFVASMPDSTNTSAELDYPLEWNLSDWTLGSIIESKGDTAIYATTPGRAGANVITVRDQAGREGAAGIAQSVE